MGESPQREWGSSTMSGTYTTYGGDPPNPKQALFHSAKPWRGSLVKGAVGGLGGGKSRCCEEEQIRRCIMTPYGVSMALRASMTRAKITIVDDYKKLLRGYARWMPSEEAFIFPNGHKLHVLPGSDYDRFGSSQLVTFYIQEAQEAPYEVFDALTQRLRNPAGMVEGVPYFCGLFDARGVGTKHWISEKFISLAWDASTPEASRQYAKNPAFVYVKFSTLDNKKVLERDSPGYIESLVRNHKNDLKWQRVFIHGETGTEVDGEAVFSDFDPEKHVGVIEEDRTLPMLRSVDFGQRHPAVTWSQLHGDGRFVVLRELCPRSIRQDDLHAEVKALQSSEFPDRSDTGYYDYGDAAGTNEMSNATASQIESWENAFGTSMNTSRRFIKDGHEVIRNLMATFRKYQGRLVPRFMVDESCRQLIAALSGGYSYKIDKNSGLEYVEQTNPYKDVVDSVRYVAQIVTVGENPFPNQQPDDGSSMFLASY
jgi:hypothetical protein